MYHSTLYSYCQDVSAMRHFYVELLGLEETFFDAERGWLTFNSGQLNMVFIQSANAQPLTDWARQPTRSDNTLEVASWVISADPAHFDTLVARLQAANVPTQAAVDVTQAPGHRHYWVRDPMGTTLEIYAAPA